MKLLKPIFLIGKKIKNGNFEGGKRTTLGFYADCCSPCKVLTPIFQELSKEYNGKLTFTE